MRLFGRRSFAGKVAGLLRPEGEKRLSGLRRIPFVSPEVLYFEAKESLHKASTAQQGASQSLM